MKYLILLLTVFNIAYATLTTKLDRNVINLGESVNLTIISDNANNGQIDLAPLQQKFTIIGSSRSTEINFLNGKKTERTQWVISFIPSKGGNEIIPALKIGNEITKTLNLVIRPSAAAVENKKTNNPQQQANALPVFIEASLSPQQTYINSQIDYTVKVFYAVNDLRGQLIPPSLNNMMFKILGSDRQYQVRRNNQPYNVLERHYIFAAPSTVGEYKIPGVSFEGMAPLIVNAAGTFPVINNNPINISAPEFKLHVKTLPMGAAFASKKVSLTQHWEKTENWQVGQPVTRSITLQAQGVSGEQLPQLSQNSPSSVNHYAEPTVYNSELINETIVGTRTEKISIIPQTAGEIIFPAIQIAWFNTDTQKIEYTHLPAQKFNIINGSQKTTLSPPPVKGVLEAVPKKEKNSNIILWLILIITILVIIILVMILKNRIKSSPCQGGVRGGSLSLVKQACQNNYPKTIQATILDWAKSQWPTAKIQTLDDILMLEITPELKIALEELNITLYLNEKKNCNGHKIWHAVTTQLKIKPTKKVTTHKNELPTLYN
jgi:hypothetical protein